jgi:TolB-like protein
MSQNPSKLARFWKELKRRKVVHVITVYASVAFVIIELVNNLGEPLNLPSGLATIIVVVLAVGFPLAVILSWIYDLTGEGFQRTEPIPEPEAIDEIKTPNAWKISTYVSFIVILGLLTYNILDRNKSFRVRNIQSIAILPFDNYTGNDNLNYVAAGMHSSLISDMGRLGALRVTGKTSSSVYRNTDISAIDIAEELNVQALIEPVLMCYGDSICIQIRLVSIHEEERILFVREYKTDRDQVFNLYSDITKQIAGEISIELSPEQIEALSRSRKVDREAFDAYLRSQEYWGDFAPKHFQNTLNYLQEAIEKDPEWATPYMALAQYWMWAIQWGYEMPSDAFPRAMENLQIALELDPDLPDAHYLKGWIAFVSEWDWEKAENEFIDAITSNPNHAETRIYYAHLLCILQRPREAAAHARLALDLDPLNPTIQILYSTAQIFIDRCESDQSQIDKLLTDDPNNYGANYIRNYLALRCKNYTTAIRTEKIILKTLLGKKFDEDTWKEIENIFSNDGYHAAYDSIVPIWEDHFNNTTQSPMELAGIYTKADRYDKVMDLIEEAYEIRDHTMPYITTAYPFEPLYDNPRFLTILEKMKLPLPNN